MSLKLQVKGLEMYNKYSMEDYESVMRLRNDFCFGATKIFNYLIKRGITIKQGTIGSWIYYNRKPIYRINKIKEGSEKLTKDKAYILGVLCSDGYLSTSYRVGLESCDSDFIDEFSRCLDTVYGIKSKVRMRVRCTNFGRGKPQYSVVICSKLVIEDLLRYSKSFKSKEWIVPNKIKTTKVKIQATFLKGLFDSEGSIIHMSKGRGYLQLCSGNKSSLLEVKDMLNRYFGIKCSVKFNQSNVMMLISADYNSIQKFYKNISLSINRKQRILINLLSSYKRKGIRRYTLDFKKKAMELLSKYKDHRFVGQVLQASYTNIYDWEKKYPNFNFKND